LIAVIEGSLEGSMTGNAERKHPVLLIRCSVAAATSRTATAVSASVLERSLRALAPFVINARSALPGVIATPINKG
jgi:hypothetical protein